MWQCHKFKALFPAASGSRSPGIDNSNWILKTAAQESRTTALGGTCHSPACLPPCLASTPSPGQSRTVQICWPANEARRQLQERWDPTRPLRWGPGTPLQCTHSHLGRTSTSVCGAECSGVAVELARPSMA
ncbi:GD11902 [Drosophila simulans]|uniref:GD11902 n=1 Tax=Drosophila simulans TaxID=7240 RepID=B4QCL0_DROSI|nr:GD11902 [Drosophila simulans]